ncbi:hypothetical protein HOD30_05115 [Candidatus Peregrinibacteria bacterium]|jgi:bifunctional DNA-binding transcriptional regulator/antitoxin component of YhaV-PrlF toxin-antitoxin module|nr:hypothetical protein [Candidatus Peregrinibacteria bacterium]MBT4631404.1 hypothetical protein [Candidatus Peregrinibacteria bacterium]
MKVVKVTTSGQISIPKVIRMKVNADCFTCELTPEGILFRPVDSPIFKAQKDKKYDMKDLLNFKVKSKNKEQIAHKIDSIIYTI